MNKVFCLGDGYAHGHLWPEWPQILKALLPDTEVEVISAIGAGPEFLVSELLARQIQGSLVIFQWPSPQRFDKLLVGQTWDEIIQNDPVYNSNTYAGKSGNWWCSSASTVPEVEFYHKRYCNPKQSVLRSENYKRLVDAYLEQQKCTWTFTTTYAQDKFIKDENLQHLRGSEVQPSPITHLKFLMGSIVPSIAVDVGIDPDRLDALQSLIENTTWTAYDPDRESIWQEIVSQLP